MQLNKVNSGIKNNINFSGGNLSNFIIQKATEETLKKAFNCKTPLSVDLFTSIALIPVEKPLTKLGEKMAEPLSKAAGSATEKLTKGIEKGVKTGFDSYGSYYNTVSKAVSKLFGL